MLRLPDGPVVNPGIIDDVALFVYRDRQSAFLALALYDCAGGRIWGALNRSDKGGQPSKVPGHFGVQINNKIYDIDGPHYPDVWKRKLASEVVPLSRKELRQWQKEHQLGDQWMRPHSFQEQYDLARSFLPVLLDRDA